MQEIKFKVWDGKRIYGVKNIEFAEDGIIITKGDGCFGCIGSDFKLLQYTGLRDKNGVEIYEGDIIYSHHVEDGKAGPVTFSNIHHGYIINYPRENGREQWQLMHGKEHCYEVIGNIYQNPDRNCWRRDKCVK